MKIKIAVPSKGRISEPSINILEKAGLGLKDRESRKLISKTQIYEIENVNSNNFEMNIIFDSYNLKEKTRFFGFEVNSKEKNYTIVTNVDIQKIKRNEYEMNSKIKIQYSGINITKMLIYFKLEHILGELGGLMEIAMSMFRFFYHIIRINFI